MSRASATPVQKFGKDHWSTFAYAETCCFDGAAGLGLLALQKMRCNGDKRPFMGSVIRWAPKYGTRLAGYFEFAERAEPARAEAAGLQLSAHDDWDCLDDLEAAGFLEILNQTHGAVRMTALGSHVAAALRKHKTEGGMMANFTWSDAPALEREVACG